MIKKPNKRLAGGLCKLSRRLTEPQSKKRLAKIKKKREALNEK